MVSEQQRLRRSFRLTHRARNGLRRLSLGLDRHPAEKKPGQIDFEDVDKLLFWSYSAPPRVLSIALAQNTPEFDILKAAQGISFPLLCELSL